MKQEVAIANIESNTNQGNDNMVGIDVESFLLNKAIGLIPWN